MFTQGQFGRLRSGCDQGAKREWGGGVHTTYLRTRCAIRGVILLYSKPRPSESRPPLAEGNRQKGLRMFSPHALTLISSIFAMSLGGTLVQQKPIIFLNPPHALMHIIPGTTGTLIPLWPKILRRRWRRWRGGQRGQQGVSNKTSTPTTPPPNKSSSATP